jgi:DNA-binding response OmpR family regulator
VLSPTAAPGDPGRATVSVRVAGGATRLRGLGFLAREAAGEIAFVDVGRDELRALRALPGLRSIERTQRLLPTLDHSVPLTTAEFNLLAALAQNQGRAMSREELFSAVFGRRFNPLDRAIDNVVAKLRAKLGDPVRGPSMIRTVRPVGYVFTGFPAEAGRQGG